MSVDVKVVATGIIALCLALSVILFLSSTANPSLEGIANRFFGLAVVLIAVVVLFSIVGIKLKFP